MPRSRARTGLASVHNQGAIGHSIEPYIGQLIGRETRSGGGEPTVVMSTTLHYVTPSIVHGGDAIIQTREPMGRSFGSRQPAAPRLSGKQRSQRPERGAKHAPDWLTAKATSRCLDQATLDDRFCRPAAWANHERPSISDGWHHLVQGHDRSLGRAIYG
jgi:hypothetical protein